MMISEKGKIFDVYDDGYRARVLLLDPFAGVPFKEKKKGTKWYVEEIKLTRPDGTEITIPAGEISGVRNVFKEIDALLAHSVDFKGENG